MQMNCNRTQIIIFHQMLWNNFVEQFARLSLICRLLYSNVRRSATSEPASEVSAKSVVALFDWIRRIATPQNYVR